MSNSKKISIYVFFIFSLFLGFYLGENSSGGSKNDFEVLLPYVKIFEKDFFEAIQQYINNPSVLILSPVHYIIVANLNNFFGSFFITKVFYILLSSVLPLIFYKILQKKININHDLLFLFSCLIFLSPYFRSSSIWITGDNLSLIFFALSVLFYLKAMENTSQKINFFLCVTFLILCSYVRYYYALFIFFYFLEFYKKLDLKWILIILIYCFFVSIPAIFYLYYIISNNDFFHTASNYSNNRINYLSNFFIILSIFLFYLFPFLVFSIKKIFKYYFENRKPIVFLYLFLLLYICLDLIFHLIQIEFSIYGGGVFVKFFELLNFDLKISIFVVSFFAILAIDFLFKDNRKKNYLLLLITIFCFPIFSVFQKYFDPLFYILFFGLFSFKKFDEIIKLDFKKLSFIYAYFSFFLIFAINYYQS